MTCNQSMDSLGINKNSLPKCPGFGALRQSRFPITLCAKDSIILGRKFVLATPKVYTMPVVSRKSLVAASLSENKTSKACCC